MPLGKSVTAKRAKLGKAGGRKQKRATKSVKKGKGGISKAGKAMAAKFGIDNVKQGRGGYKSG